MAAEEAPDGRPGLRVRKKQRTAETIRHAAIELFSAKGYDGTTVEEIADSADVSVSTFFRYFPTKDAVLLRTADGAELVRRGLEGRPDGESLWSNLGRSLLEGLPSLIDHPAEEIERIRIAYSTPSVRGAIAGAMAAMRREIASVVRPHLGRRVDADLQAQVIAAALCGAIEVTQDAFIAAGGKGNGFALLSRALAMYGEGLEEISSAQGRSR